MILIFYFISLLFHKAKETSDQCLTKLISKQSLNICNNKSSSSDSILATAQQNVSTVDIESNEMTLKTNTDIETADNKEEFKRSRLT